SDGWSVDVLRREFVALYKAFADGLPSPLPPLPLQYADFAAWQRRWLTGTVLEEQTAFWRERLAGIPADLELPTDLPRPVVQTFTGRTVNRPLPRELVQRVNALGMATGGTLFMTMLAAFSALLGRWAGQDDVVVGSPIAGRNRPETEGLIGFFVNNLVMRTDLSGAPTFRERLARVRRSTLDAYAHQDLPFERLVDELQVPRSSSRTPIFQVVLNLFNQRGGEGSATAGELDDPAKYDLSLVVMDQGADVVASLNYTVDLFRADTIHRMLDHLTALLEQVTADPDLRIDRVDLLSPAERELAVSAWNATATEYPRDASVPALFAAQAQATPDAVALTAADGKAITYAELDARANRIARHLRARGVTRGTRVGLSVDRSPELIAALLGIVKAGAAYVPLDPSYPAERLAYMAGDADVTHLVVLDAVPDALAGFAGDVIRLETNAQVIAGLSPDAVDVDLTGDDLCYVIYTSGSTGQPKGVAVPHRGVVRLVKENGFASFAADEVVLQLAPIAFDASTFEVWGPLLNGARLVLYPPETPSLDDMGRFIESRGITTLWLTAGLFHQMVDTQLPRLRGVRQLLAGGDVLSPPHVARAIAALPDTKVINGYGPTESTTFACCHTVQAEDASKASVPIGGPIANTRVFVLDAHLRPAPLAVAGDLYIAGDGLAHGYLNQPAMTAERFIPDPYATEPGGRLYRSGDRARWLADGTLEFLGRADEQVKIRGFRIELGEIEAALAAHATVRDAAVVAREDGADGGRRLVAYVVARDGAAADAGELAAHLRGRLPEHMVPAAFVVLPALPLTANGKVDRRALPAPTPGGDGDAFVAPRTETERALAEIWAGCLTVERVGVHDNFFALGGHSLVATRVVSAIRERLRVELPLRALFAAQTVAELAPLVDAEQPAAPESAAPPLVPVPRLAPIPASFAQARLWFVERRVPGTPTYNVPTPLPLAGDVDAGLLERAIGE
ncbi:MAG TPA: amino acid adenylation domain-containing protein, partial [Longimicrobiaceae bacterium]|nr:amino acid adenylation domain-containing protein [Longimicrobiaceae bacterium]